jgi:hypothetical protein
MKMGRWEDEMAVVKSEPKYEKTKKKKILHPSPFALR